MKFKNLLSLSVMLSCGLVSQAQVLQESFDAAQTKQAADAGFYEFINLEEGDEWKIETSGGFKNGALSIDNNSEKANDNSTWMRAVKFRNLPLQEGKSYRLTYYISGSSTYGDNKATKARIGLMQGVENADIAINNSIADISNITSDFVKHTHMFYFKNKAEQDAEYDKQCKSKEAYAEANKDKYFAVFNVYNPGQFKLDEVTLEEASIAGIGFNGGVICIDLGYASNIATLANQKSSGNYVLDNSTVVVKQDGEEVEPLSVELRGDGKIYIFFEEKLSGEVEVTFTNPDGLIVLTNGPELTTITEKAVKNTSIDPDLEADVYAEASVESVTPANGSFALETKDIKTITVTFDRPVFTEKTKKAGAPEATLSDGTKLTLKATERLSKTLTFEYAGADLGKGTYNITISNIVNQYGTLSDDIVLTYEFGKVELAEIVYTDILAHHLTGENGKQPEGWTIMVGGENWAGGTPKEDNGAACRNVNIMAGETEIPAFYLCDRDGYTYMQYGDQEGARLTLPAGDIEFGVIAVGHEDATRTVDYRLEDMNGNVVLSVNGATTINAGNNSGDGSTFTTIDAAGTIAGRFTNDKEQNFILKVREPEGGFKACRVIGFKAQHYKIKPGDIYEPQVMLGETFASCGGNMPAEGSGWTVYENNNPLAPGSGRSGTSGILILGKGGMPAAFFARECGSNEAGNMRITYGEQEGGPQLELGANTYEVSYKSATWNDQGGNDAGTSKTYFQIIDAATGSVVCDKVHVNSPEANYKNGVEANPDVLADKVSFTFKTQGGKFIIKAWGSTNTVVGDIQIVIPGSNAAKWYQALADAVKLAQTEAELASDAKYAGKTKDALDAAIKKNTENIDMHTEPEFTAAIAQIENLIKQSTKRRNNIDNFAKSLETIKKGIDEAKESKYKDIPEVAIAEGTYDKYKEVDYIKLEDDALAEAVSEMTNKGSLLSNMVKTCLPLVTKQITDLAAAIAAIEDVTLDPKAEEAEMLIAAGNATSDDQSLVGKLKAIYAAKIYAQLADDKISFKTVDEDTKDETVAPIPVSFLIQNANFYSTAQTHNGDVAAKETDFPGWTIQKVSGTIAAVWGTAGWCGEPATEIKPVVDAAVKSTWGTHEYDVKQLINLLPVAKYRASIIVGEDGGDPHGAYAYLGEGEAQVKSEYKGNEEGSYSRDNSTPQVFENVAPTIKGNFAEITLGAHMNVAGGFGRVDNATLEMVGKVEGFDYKAAAKQLATSIDKTVATPAGAPINVQYFGIDGKPTLNPQGVTIKVESWANGFVKISKVVK